MTGDKNDVIRHKFPMQNVYDEDKMLLWNTFKKAYENPLEGASCEIRYIKSDGGLVCYRIRTFFLRENNNRKMFYGSVADVTGEKNQELELSIAEKQLESALRLSGINSFDWDILDDKLSLVNTYSTEAIKSLSPAFGEKYKVIQNFKSEYSKLFRIRIINYRETRKFFAELIRGKNKSIYNMDIGVTVQDSNVSWIRVSCEAITDMWGRVSHITGSFADVTEALLAKSLLEKQALTDALTGIYNRHGGVALIKNGLKRLKKDENAALVMLDLDNFKGANDTYGHQFGDALLKQVANILAKSFREDDVVCRIGGDEFMVWCKGVDKESMAKKAAEIVDKIRSADGGIKTYNASCTIGYVISPEHGKKFNDLYQKADEAMFYAKKLGKNTFYEYKLSE